MPILSFRISVTNFIRKFNQCHAVHMRLFQLLFRDGKMTPERSNPISVCFTHFTPKTLSHIKTMYIFYLNTCSILYLNIIYLTYLLHIYQYHRSWEKNQLMLRLVELHIHRIEQKNILETKRCINRNVQSFFLNQVLDFILVPCN